MVSQLTGRLKRLLSSHRQILSNISWMMVSEMLARISRFVTLFVLAACFSTVQYGVVMLALVCHEVVRIFTRLGVGVKIIQTSEPELHETLGCAVTVQWCVAILVASIQILIAPFVAVFYDNPDLVVMLQIMAISHIIYPVVAVKVFLLQRHNRLRYFGIASGLSVAFENLVVAGLVWCSGEILVVAWAKNLAAFFWVLVFINCGITHPAATFRWPTISGLLEFSARILSTELIKSLRWQIDSLIAGRLLSPELFGLYSFAKSASVGIGQTLTSAYVSAIYPYFCQMRRNGSFQQSLSIGWLSVVILSLGFSVQSLLAPWYIEWLFGDRWLEAVSVAVGLCLLSIPILISEYISSLFRTLNAAGTDLWLNLTSVLAILVCYSMFLPDSPTDIMQVMLLAGLLWSLCSIGTWFFLKPDHGLSHPVCLHEGARQ